MKNFVISIAVTALIHLVPTHTMGQGSKKAEEKIPLSERLSFGGNLGLQIGNPTLIDVSPTLGYKVTPKFMPGIGLTYIYYGYTYSGQYVSTHVYGGRLFARYNVWQQLFLHTEFEMLNFEDYQTNGRQWVPAWLAGGGYTQSLGGHSTVYIMVLWNLLESATKPSLYNNPIIRVGINL